MIFELIVINFCINKIKENKKENYTDNKNNDDSDTKISTGVLVTVLIIAIVSLILSIWGIVDSVKRCQGDDRIVGVILAIFCWPLYWILRLSGAVCKKN